jgi:hydrogenase nickel incorporation protein HypA/HybF
MHEFSLMNDLLRKIKAVAHEQRGTRVVGVHVWLGALSHISSDHFREHFVEGAKGTVAQDAVLKIETDDDVDDPHAQDILLRSIEVDH